MKKRILITAGGTAEKIDQVRSITNHSTGKLGSFIADLFLKHDYQVDYVTTASALRPTAQINLTVEEITDTQQLDERLTFLLTKNRYDAVIHSMAVSDFTPVKSYTQKDFVEQINQHFLKSGLPLTEADLANMIETPVATTTSKISSNTDYLFLALKQTPKVIQKIKVLQPDTLLVSFKLLVDVPKAELLQVALASMQKNQGDFVLANDLTTIKGHAHTGYLLNKEGQIVGEAQTKEAIAQLITQTILNEGTKEV